MANVLDLLSKRRELESLRAQVVELENEIGNEHTTWLENQETIAELSEAKRLLLGLLRVVPLSALDPHTGTGLAMDLRAWLAKERGEKACPTTGCGGTIIAGNDCRYCSTCGTDVPLPR